jgi:hypothetical protein
MHLFSDFLLPVRLRYFYYIGRQRKMMKDPIIEKIAEKTGIPHIVDLLASRLSGSELNSLLLEVFEKRRKDISPALLLQQYQVNRFVQPAGTDMIELLTRELTTLQFLKEHHFQPVELSPAAQWGSCSIVGTVDQKKIISATRNTEIVADATNSIALHIAGIRRSTTPPHDELRFCTVHRHIRTQTIKVKGFTPHFKIGCMVSAGRDTGSFRFESIHLQEHIQTLGSLFRDVYGIDRIRFKLQKREGYPDNGLLLERVMAHLANNIPTWTITREDPPGTNNYYKGIQFKMIIEVNGREIEIADGGFVDWTQQLLGNNKERMLISGFGLELLYKLQKGLV